MPLKGITVITALIIQSHDDLIVTYAGPNPDGKYCGWITLGPEDYCRPLLNSEFVFDSGEQAEESMKRLVSEIRTVDPLTMNQE